MKPLQPARSRAWRRLFSAPLLVALGACATYYDDPTHRQSAAESSGGGAGNGGTAAGGAAGSAIAGGPLGGAGSVSSGGGGMLGGAGAALGGAGAGGLATAGSAGRAGAATGGAGAGGAGGGGAGGKAGAGGGGSAGNAGAGGAGQPRCDDHPLSAKSKWVVTASSSDGPAPPAQAVDGDLATRWTTGKEQIGGEWLQIDFGVTVSLTQLSLVQGSSGNDYPRKYATRFSNSSQNTAAPVLLSGVGAANTDTVMNFSKVISGRYLLITQGGTAPALWWSVAEIQAQCAD